MQRREVLAALFAGLGASIASSRAQALTHFAPLSAPLEPTGDDLNAAKIEKAFGRGYWRHRRRRARRYGREEYGRDEKK